MGILCYCSSSYQAEAWNQGTCRGRVLVQVVQKATPVTMIHVIYFKMARKTIMGIFFLATIFLAMKALASEIGT